jgi:hypothetical protein
MRRIGRIAGNLATIISALASIASIVFWARSMGREDRIVHYDGARVFSTHISFGAVDSNLMQHTCSYWETPKHTLGWQFASRPFALSAHDSSLRKQFGLTGFIVGSDPCYHLYLPLWAICLATALLPVGHMMCWRVLRRRVARGHCRGCGYDLRATPQRCPECGVVGVIG